MKKAKLIIDTVIIGLIGAASAQIFVFLLKLISDNSLKALAKYTPPDVLYILKNSAIPSYSHPWIALFVLITGGLISGILVYSTAPEAEGHGTDTAVRSFHRTGGYIRPIVTPIKILASAITIGTGGSAGREGPTALFSSGVGSIYATIKKATSQERRLFVLIGMASGLSAIFRAPIGTSIFAIEVLYSDMEFEAEALVYTLLGSLIAYMTTGFLMGWQPIFTVPQNLQIDTINTYFYLALLGLISGITGVILPNVFYYVRDGFRLIKIPPHFKPAIGAAIVGLIAFKFPQVLGGGYGWIQEAIYGKIAVSIALFLIVAKMLAFTFTVSSGGSGGVFAPTLFIGAMLGCAFAHLLHQNPSIFAVIGMAAVFGSAARAPLATTIMVTEMTGGYNLLAAAALSVLLAYLVQVEISRRVKAKYFSLYEAQVPDKNYSPVHQLSILKNIIMCNLPSFSISPKEIEDKKILNLLETGMPIRLPNDKVLFFGTLLKSLAPERENEFLKYKNVKIIYIFRDGKWLHPAEIDELTKGDEILICGKPGDVLQIKDVFKKVPESFSKLKKQQINLQRHTKKKVPV
ncbi:chloride channel protein [Hippea alviniae]|uniref:chloride channel protein n=1 Tax=Hippea alviniae TaxID=1279027 RepID=UPI0003B59768|nr:chloride channel protein [Hippea alviniae]